MAEERVDRARKMVCRNRVLSMSSFFLFHLQNSRDHLSIYALHSEPLFFQHFDGPYFPTLRLLHKCELYHIQLYFLLLSEQTLTVDPFILPHVRIDRGAIRFLLAGAHMMCPGLTSAGGWLPPADAALPAGTPIAFDAEGKEFAVGVGITKLGTEEMKAVNKGVAVESITYVGDDLWAIQKL
jgi:PUA domain protein